MSTGMGMDEDVSMSLEQPPRPPPRQFHSFMISGTQFEVETRYSNLRALGSGSYGLVCSADDSVTGNKVAIKKITDAFEDLIDAKRILREIKLLKHLSGHENIIALTDLSVMPCHSLDFNDIYIITEAFECDLDRIISSNQPLSDQHAQYFLYQILRGLKYVHSANVLHRDLKPSNLLVNSNCDLSICDFGLARGVITEYEDTLTEYVVTRWYRAPELLTDSKYYGSGVDVWSTGCIFAEILCRTPLFQGRDFMHQLQVIIEMLGTPSSAQLDFISNTSARRAIQNFGKFRKRPLSKIPQFQNCNPLAIDLLSKMLVFDPRGRITVDEALEHPYLADLHDENEVPLALSNFNLDFEKGYKAEMPKDVMQRLIFEDMVTYHPEEVFYTAQNSARSDGSTSSRSSAGSQPVRAQPSSDYAYDNFPKISKANKGRQRAAVHK